MDGERRKRLEETTRYDPAQVEARVLEAWLEGGYFHPEATGSPAENYSISIPPPNITGALHMGHALNGSIQDALIRLNRMRGRNTLWALGTDHAGIATQSVVEKQLREEGVSRHDLGREEFVKRVWEWREQYGSTIVEQFKRLGASCDYERERFTLDEGYVRAVLKVFVALYEKGYIYRDNYMVNWDPGSRSAISDLEVENREVTDTIYSIDYPLEGSDEAITVATVRPETMLADTAVAVHPDDERYAALVGRHCVLPIVGRRLEIIADEYVDPEFGTGALKITPGHDVNDFEIGRRHGLEEITAIAEDGTMSEAAGEGFAGLSVLDAREKVVAALRAEGRIGHEEPYTHSVPFSHRSGERVEPLISLQWFCRMDELAKPAIEVVKRGDVRFVPERWGRVYLDWMSELRPWCVSRQLWWGHRLPVYYCDACEETYVAEEPPAACERCGGVLRQDEDVLDTWFSSALWPFAVLGWPDDTPELLGVLPHRCPGHGPGHHLPLGCPDGDDGPRVPGGDPVHRRLHNVGHPGARRPADVEVARHRDRPARRDRRARRRRCALRPLRHVLDPGRPLLAGEDPAGPRPRQQDVERVAADPAERGRRHRGPVDRPERGPLDPLASGADGRLRIAATRRLRLRPRRAGPLRLLLVGALRLVPGDRQAPPLRR